MSLLTHSPIWFAPLCVLAGIIYAGALYFRDRFNRNYGSQLAALLGVIRFAAVTILCFFLLRPLLRSTKITVDKPIVLIAQDNSESIAIGKDSAFYRNEYLQQIRNLAAAFGDSYEVQTCTFGDHIRDGLDSINFSEKQTDFSELFNDVYNRYSGRNLGALIIASDGLYNRGANPVYGYKKLNVPVYTIGLGDTTSYRDLLIKEVAVNRLAYLGNQFPMEIVVEGKKASGESSAITISHQGKTLFTETFQPEVEMWSKTYRLNLDAKEIGLQKYTISVQRIAGEITYNNNVREVFIEVLDSREKILILAQSPHPDIAALAEAISSGDNYQVKTSLLKEFKDPILSYDFVIFHQLPAASAQGQDIIKQALEGGVPSMFVWGAATDFNAFNQLGIGFSLQAAKAGSTDVGGAVDDQFTLFQTDPLLSKIASDFPPLTIPFGDLSYSPGASPFMLQRLGTLKTKKPLIAFNRFGEKEKTALIAGEGIWRWRLEAFERTQSQEVFNDLCTRMTQYMCAGYNRSQFRVSSEHHFMENEPVIFFAELYNSAFEPLSGQEIRMNIRNEENQEFQFLFSQNGSSYRLDAGQLPVGNYKYEAYTGQGNTLLKATGQFSVSPVQAETMRTEADFRMLQQLARENNGSFASAREMQNLAEMIKTKKEIVSIAYENKSLDELINLRWILFLIIALLCLEWLLRKRAGTY